MKNQIIINTEYFLQCAGSCSGCFLTADERNSANVFYSPVMQSLKQLVAEFTASGRGQEFFVVGLGRGNHLILSDEDINLLGYSIRELEKTMISQEIVFEVSTSLVGKIDSQISKAKNLLNFSNNIYFNIVINSEITSKKFWSNLKVFHNEMTKFRIQKGFVDKTGDIFVLNINPHFLPDLNELEGFLTGLNSPINVSLFPFDSNYYSVNEDVLESLKNWTIKAGNMLKDYDLNIQNQLGMIDFELSDFNSVIEHIEKTKGTYFFIDKEGKVSNGQPSIMGEVDYPRLIEKYQLNIDVKKSFLKMQTLKSCKDCQYQKECLITGAYLNMLSNEKKMQKMNYCPSGYKEFFKLFLPKI